MAAVQKARLTPQERRILDGKGMSLAAEEKGGRRERLDKMLEKFRGQTPRIAVDRSRLMVEAFRENENLPLTLKWAKGLENIAKKIPIYIGDGELIVGRCGPGERHGLIYPELRSGWLENVKDLGTRKLGQFGMTDEDVRTCKEEIAPYWEKKSWHDLYYSSLPEETQRVLWEPNDIYRYRGAIASLSTLNSLLNWSHDYQVALTRGFKDIKREAKEKSASLDVYDRDNNYTKMPFYKAVILSCDAIVTWANRHAEAATSMAETESNERRKRELIEIANTCRWVPENPARTFREAVQTLWFCNAFSRFEQTASGHVGLGRIDQFLYPYYKKDQQDGRITDDEVLELLGCLWLNLARNAHLYQLGSISYMQGYAHFEQTMVGGQTADGRDATNELSYLILQSKKEFPLDYPDLSARIHARTPEPFLRKVCELIKEGTGFPKLYNDEEVVPLFLAKGATLEEARNYTGTSCTEARILGRETYMTISSQVSLGAAVEMSLHDGTMKSINEGEERIGVSTGDPRNFKSWDDMWTAFRLQVENLLKHAFTQHQVADVTKPQRLAAPFYSSLHPLCMAQGLDIHVDQGKFKEDISLGNVFPVGFGTAIDSLAAIKKLVYDDKVISMGELLDALDANFHGKEAIRQLCLNAPKYGNVDVYADSIGRHIERIMCDCASKYTNPWGGHDDIVYVPVTSHVGFGGAVGATPNGRRAGEALSEGVSPTQGCDIKGPTATLQSIDYTKNSSQTRRASRLLNLKFSPQVVEGEAGTNMLGELIRAWCDMKFWHIQFNVINRETLIEARKHPENYRNLLVRVAGYSAYFVELSPELQDEIIARTEHSRAM
jgi:pyruvate formate-lyase/glycerol dehydratase family glycyl radical enzyme